MRPALTLLPLTILSASCAADEPATAPSDGQRECFWGSQVTGFSDAGPDRAILNIGQRESWELALATGCPDVDWALRIGIRARGGDRICPGRPAELLIPNASGSGFQRCLVQNVRKLSPEEAAAVRGKTSKQ
ncbi:DUF6491 family protein [Sphingomonas sp. BT-65]|uniref:DUF6491 family protein n=1 Tax=Sphingomonas sp. BT-65 TaxID=2989821 RepID=UPI00223681A5|nr:DUF6491 family protein [Sphingomonas sp. BT-65]MCW4462905.1 DUF6491 family protein [Sphingomonas sp. BT-65]